nr:hypothetical protein [Bacillus infantis]
MIILSGEIPGSSGRNGGEIMEVFAVTLSIASIMVIGYFIGCSIVQKRETGKPVHSGPALHFPEFKILESPNF